MDGRGFVMDTPTGGDSGEDAVPEGMVAVDVFDGPDGTYQGVAYVSQEDYAAAQAEDDEPPATLHEAVAEALQLAWDDFVTDTGCFPDCFTLGSNRTLYADFDRGNFARLVAMWLEPRLEQFGSNPSGRVRDGYTDPGSAT